MRMNAPCSPPERAIALETVSPGLSRETVHTVSAERSTQPGWRAVTGHRGGR